MADYSGVLLIENLLCQTNGKALVAEGSLIEKATIVGRNSFRNAVTTG